MERMEGRDKERERERGKERERERVANWPQGKERGTLWKGWKEGRKREGKRERRKTGAADTSPSEAEG